MDTLTLNSTTSNIELVVAVTDYVLEFSDSVVANITFPGDPIPRVTLDPASTLINIDGLFRTIIIIVCMYHN